VPRRVSLPGADELFRTTGGMALQSTPRQHNGDSQTGAERLRAMPAPAGEPDAAEAGEDAAQQRTAAPAEAGQRERRGAPEHSGRGEGDEGAAQHRRDTSGAGAAASPERQQAAGAPAKRKPRGANRRPSGRERHDEKITVYVSAEELMDLEHARLVLRGEHGLAVDRGRIVREAVAVVLADLESRGDASILVRRLRGR
jgi:hypothetical protein